ncbi:metallophosphoesterase [Streptomyces katsurahamanus]|uniref:Metallophosphoesterase n=1 Tax=Streptomyces katsurahamanus TaxID=2577098 RepID=A0ABW9NYJ8_9ACTN|nr:metallophosphoesterase [Streptomyces katsurahamanus]MQS38216.1 metallophosphoesterase [Streptomyces katsurahamanus]
MAFVLVLIAVIALLAGAHWYVWRRLVRDTTRGPGAVRRAGTAAVWALPTLSLGLLVSGWAGAPFWLQQVLAWPGYLWLVVLLYLVLALLAGEAVRAVWLRKGKYPRAAGTPESPEGPGFAPSADDGTDGADRTTVPSASTAPDGRALGSGTATMAETEAEAGVTALAGGGAGGGTATGVSRRLFVSRAVGAGAVAAAAGIVGHGTYGVLRGPGLKRVTVPLAKLPRSAHGFRIAVVSDIHIGPILGRAHTQRIVDAINSAQPDLVAVVGDMVDGSVADLGSAAEPLAQLRARHGSFFVTGNHEYYSGAEEWIDHVRELGLDPLENERVEIAGGFDLAGVNDLEGEATGAGPDFAKALGDRDPSRASVLMAHQPVVIHDAVDHGVDLQLSGHTHGGQLWPGNYLAELANPTVAGLERYGDTQLYVTRGAGAWGPPVRVGAESDITIVQLASRQA